MAARRTCLVCGSRKVLAAFSPRAAGSRGAATCTECLGQVLGSDPIRAGLDLEEPEQEPETTTLEDLLVTTTNAINVQDAAEQSIDASMDKSTRKRKRRNATGWPTTKRRKQPQTRRPPLPQAAECRICAEEKDISEFVKNARSRKTSTLIPFECLIHLGYKQGGNLAGGAVCKSCIGNSLAASLDTIGAENLGCLEPECSTGPWEYEYISQYMPAEALEKYHEQMFTTFMASASTFKCLNAECGAVGLLENTAPGFPHVVCTACSQRHCALCEVLWHENLSCQAYRAKNHKELVSADEKATLRMLSKAGAKRCPRCQLAIEKDGGCNSMYCINCRRNFDWFTAEPVFSVASKKAQPVTGQVGYWRELCESDALAALEPVGTAQPLLFG